MKQQAQNDNSVPLYGLVLSGGRSSRMGTDKGLLTYHDKPQREFLYKLLHSHCDKTFLSLREDQRPDDTNTFNFILDNNKFKGPFNGILSAHEQFPRVAWLVVACDMPLLNTETLTQLVNNRDPEKGATALATNASKLPEPLAAIWEPKGLQEAIQYMNHAASSCPRKFLINSETKLVFPENDQVLANANSMEDYQQIKNVLDQI